jgi:DNA-binding MarR family transcriptional regulator
MEKLKFRERAILVALISKFEDGIIEHPLRTIANEIGVSHQTINNYLTQFEKYGLLSVGNKGSHRQTTTLNMDAIKTAITNVL